MATVKISLTHSELVAFDSVIMLNEDEWQSDLFEFEIGIDGEFIDEISYRGFFEWDLLDNKKFIKLIKSKLDFYCGE